MWSSGAAALAGIALVAGIACGKSASGRTSGEAAALEPSPVAATGSTSAAGAPTTSASTGGATACAPRDPSRPDRRPTVAVMYFDNGALTNRVDYAPLSKGIADMLVVSLRANCAIRVVEREQLQRLIAEQNLQPERMDAATRVRIGRMLGAKHMIMGGFVVDLRQQMAISATVIDAETTEHEAGVIHRDSEKNLLDMVPALAKKLNDAMKLPPIPAPTFEGARPAKREDEFAGLRLYSRALEEQDRGNKPQATQLYRAALEKFPSYTPAQDALRRLQSGR